MDAKYDPALEASLAAWISGVIGDKVAGPFNQTLKNGTVLCKLINKLQPGAVSNIYVGEMAFKQMENIGKFLAACPPFGVRSDELFQAPDLYEGTNMTAVLICVDTLRRVSDTKAKGGKVEAQTVTSSVLLKTGKVSAHDPIPKREVVNPSGNAYDKSGKDVVNAKSGDDGSFGDMSERLSKLSAKYDKGLEAVVRKWIEEKIKESLPSGDFQSALKSGVALCQLINALKPGSVKSINPSSLPFKQMENINNFITGAQAYGVRSEDLFQTVSLYEGSNMTQVLQALDNLMRLAKTKGA